MATDSPKLNEQELINGKHYGAYHVQNPITGYKKIICKQKTMGFSDLFLKYVQKIDEKPEFDAIAQLEIPKNAIIIRPLVGRYDLGPDTDYTYISTKLRTDRVLIKKIEAVYSDDALRYDMKKCECYSDHNNKYKYHVGKEQKPKKDFDNNVFKECTSGIHFYLEKARASEYFFD